MSTYIHGIGASENIDSSGERIIIAGLDISSLDKDGVFNWEHKADQPSQIVGKVLKAKKIFSEKDCEDDYQKYFWMKCQVPYLYVMGELFDDYKDSAREVAGLFRYDADKKGQNERAVGNFSVEGAKIHKEGMDVTRSIARKITITALPCNKAAVAEMVAVDQQKPNKKSIDNLFKTESIEIEVLQVSEKTNLWDMLKKEALKVKASILSPKIKKDEAALTSGASTSMALSGTAPSSPSLSLSEPDMARSEKMNKAIAPKLSIAPTLHAHGTKIGATSTGKDVHSHARVGQTGFNAHEHEEAAAHHMAAAKANPKLAQHHGDKARLHSSAAVSMKHRAATRAAQIKDAAIKRRPSVGAQPKAAPESPKHGLLHDPHLSGTVKYKKSEVLEHGLEGNAVAANQKQQRERRAQSRPNNDKQHWDQHKINHSESNPSKEKRDMVPNKQVLHPVPQGGQPKNNMLHNNLLAPKETMHKALTAGSGMASPDRLEGGAALAKESLAKCGCGMAKCATCGPKAMAKGGAYSGNVPKDKKIKELQQKIDSGTYKPDSKAIADKILKHPDKPLKKSDAYARAEEDYAKWSKREEFETFMKSRLPHMTKSEIKAFGQAMLLNKSMRLEKSLDFTNILSEKNKK